MQTQVLIILSVLFLVLIFVDILGHILKLYDKTKWFDIILHVYGGAIGALASLLILQHYNFLPLVNVLFSFCIAVTLAVLWELGEFTIDRIFNTNHQRWKEGNNTGLIDSMTDLTANIVGSLIVCIIWLLVVLL